MSLIAKDVGDKAANLPVDVIRIQDLLNNNFRFTGLKAALAVDGTVGPLMIEAIKTFQQTHPGIKSKRPDGRVSPGGPTLKRLQQCRKDPDFRSTLPRGFDANTLARPNIDGFVALYVRQYPRPVLGASGTLALHDLVARIVADTDVTDLRWAAYMLATVKHECADTWEPIEEYGRGAGKDYATAVAVKIDAKRTVNNVYYGRGYVQLTWDHRYKAMDTALGLSGDASLYLHPENALVADTAYRIMSYGMRNGSFTGLGLPRFISGAKSSYFYARQIILSLDRAALIQGYAENIDFLLRFCNGVPVAR